MLEHAHGAQTPGLFPSCHLPKIDLVSGLKAVRRLVGIEDGLAAIEDPKLRLALQEILDLAWDKLNATGAYPITRDADELREDLAQMIILAHRSGLQRDEIKAAVLGESPSQGQWREAAAKLTKALRARA